MESRLRLVLAVFLAIACMTAPAFAQATSATLSGTVKDGTGAVLPGVTIVITNTDTRLTRTIVTDARGHYAAPDLPPGPYSVKGTLQGFNSALRTGVTLTVGGDAVLDLELNLGTLTDEVSVVAEAKTVDTQTASTGGLISPSDACSTTANSIF